jgi:hypothetical protein
VVSDKTGHHDLRYQSEMGFCVPIDAGGEMVTPFVGHAGQLYLEKLHSDLSLPNLIWEESIATSLPGHEKITAICANEFLDRSSFSTCEPVVSKELDFI